ncbi:MAG: hypothetical protein LBI87_12475 [Candidatus Accumulibacter sp.]|jgi:hypothetical protein|nr:hypothetical protein [Accumulibacter sp.]
MSSVTYILDGCAMRMHWHSSSPSGTMETMKRGAVGAENMSVFMDDPEKYTLSGSAETG